MKYLHANIKQVVSCDDQRGLLFFKPAHVVRQKKKKRKAA